ncbi:MAG: glycosyltransferase [Alphaproteobacteria bacterium]|nr:glycosyltransferase [Alphaproteobacteria bacterium]
MKIVFLMNHIVMGGLEKILCEYVKAINEYDGIEVIVVSQHRVKESFFLDFFKTYNITLIDNIFPRHRAHFVLRKLIRNVVIKRKLQKLFDKYDIIIDFANFSWSRYIASINKPKMGWCHGSFLVFDKMTKMHNLDIYDKIVCLTNSCMTMACKQYPHLSDKIVHLYNPIDYKSISTQQQKSESPDSYFCAVQRLDTDKDVATVIKAFNLFSENHPGVKLLIVGDGPLRQSLTELASVNSRIIFTGQVDTPYSIISGATALILSSTTHIGEGLPTVLLEALALKTLAISSDVPSGPREILMDGQSGVLFKPGDYQELSQILSDVWDCKYDINAIKTNATASLRRFDKKRITKELIEVIKTIMK